MTEDRSRPGTPGAAGTDPAAYSRLQQQLVETRGRLDRQVGRLIRLNRVSDELIQRPGDCGIASTFAELVVDVLDVAVAAVWIVDDRTRDGDERFAVFGVGRVAPVWSEVGAGLAAHLVERGIHGAVPLELGRAPSLDGAGLRGALVSVGVGRSGEPLAVLVAANTEQTAGMAEPDGEETREILALLAEKLAAYLDSTAARQTIDEQLARLRDSEERLGQVLQGTNDGWWDWEFERNECFVSPRWLEMLGLPASEGSWLPAFWSDRIHPSDRDRFDERFAEVLVGSGRTLEIEVRLRHVDGTHLPVLVRGSVLRDEHDEPRRFAGSILDLTERHRQERQVRRLAFFDTLTELPNRRLLVDRLAHALSSVERHGRIAAVLMLDLDRFKTLNDTHGHAAGDELLRSVAGRLRSATRSSDTVARLSGDEFVVMLPDAGPDSETAHRVALQVADKIRSSMREPFEIAAGRIHHTVSVGVAVADRPGLTVDTVLKRADVAMYEAKDAGRNSVRVFEPAMETKVASRAGLEARLRSGFAAGEVSLVYQPQVDRHGAIVGSEALMRWNSPEGPVSPAAFIPAAEDSGFIHEMGTWALETACRAVVTAEGSLPDGYRVAVNLAAPEFLHQDIVERVLDVLDRTGAGGASLRLEITEATIVHDLDFAVERMRELRAHGIEFSVDDFGTGFSSLTYLRRMPIDEVKIDQSYVRNLRSDPADLAIVQAVLTMCDTLGIRVVAEGVESVEDFLTLTERGCEYFQGFHFARPQAIQSSLSELTADRTAPAQRVR